MFGGEEERLARELAHPRAREGGGARKIQVLRSRTQEILGGDGVEDAQHPEWSLSRQSLLLAITPLPPLVICSSLLLR